MDTHTYENVKLLLSPRQSRGITYWIYVFLCEPLRTLRFCVEGCFLRHDDLLFFSSKNQVYRIPDVHSVLSLYH